MNLILQNLSMIRNSIQVLDNVSFSLPHNSCLAIIGENGSGKSSLLSAISQYLKTSSGSVYLQHHNSSTSSETLNLLSMPTSLLSQYVSYLPQYRSPLTNAKALSLLLLTMSTHYPYLSESETCQSQISDAIHLTNSQKFMNVPLKRLSYGQLNRVFIAATIAPRKPLTIIDEPENALDPSSCLEIFSLLKKLPSLFNTSTIIATHNISLAYQFSDYVAILQKGSLIHFGETKKVITPQLLQNVFHVNAAFGQHNNQHFVLPLESLHDYAS